MRRKCGKPTCRCVNGETHESPALAFPVAFLLSDAPFRYGDSAIGLLGLAGAAGALCASVAGRLADRGLARIERIGAAASIAGSFGILWLGRSSIVLVIVGVLVLDVGVQGVQVLNQSTVYELVPWGTQPDQRGLHDDLLHRRGTGFGRWRVRLRPQRLASGVHSRRRARSCRGDPGGPTRTGGIWAAGIRKQS